MEVGFDCASRNNYLKGNRTASKKPAMVPRKVTVLSGVHHMSDYADITDLTTGSPLGYHLGWQTVAIDQDFAAIAMPFKEHNVTIGNIIHGGAIAALADAAATAACWATPERTDASRGTTIALNVNYLRAAADCTLTASAKVIQRGKSVCVAEVDVKNDDDVSVARVTATYKLTHN